MRPSRPGEVIAMSSNYTAVTLGCGACGRQWRTVYEVCCATGPGGEAVRFRRDGVGFLDPYHDETCWTCGAQAHVVNRQWAIPQPRSGEPLAVQP
jgi:hypothetical protein